MLLIGKHLQTINGLRQKEKGLIESDRPPCIKRKPVPKRIFCFIDPFAENAAGEDIAFFLVTWNTISEMKGKVKALFQLF